MEMGFEIKLCGWRYWGCLVQKKGGLGDRRFVQSKGNFVVVFEDNLGSLGRSFEEEFVSLLLGSQRCRVIKWGVLEGGDGVCGDVNVCFKWFFDLCMENGIFRLGVYLLDILLWMRVFFQVDRLDLKGFL